MPSVSTPASIVNIDFISTEQDQQKSESSHELSDQQPYQGDRPNNFSNKTNNSFPSHESYADLSPILNVNRFNAPEFLNRAGFNNNSLDENNRVLDEIKTSLKGMNNEWNKIEGRADFLLEMGSINTFVNSAPVDNNILGRLGQQRQSIDTQIKQLEVMAERHGPTDIEEKLRVQSLLYELLFFISIPHLLKLISANSTSLILLVLLWLFIKGLIEFFRWKKKKKARSRLKRKRSIDGFTKY
jgi:hypothetical protein